MSPRHTVRRACLLAALLLSAAAGLTACHKDQPPAPAKSGARACASNDECDRGWICLNGHCADMKGSAVYTRPDEAVTPNKVKLEVERLQKSGLEGADKAMHPSE